MFDRFPAAARRSHHMAPVRRATSSILLVTTALSLGAVLPGLARAQEAPAATATANEGDIIVTASRIVREGYEAPTPTTVIGAERLSTAANSNLAQFVTTLPAFVGSGNSRSTLAAGAVGTTGINSINLRGLGANRTLVLFDGHRMTPAHPNGDIDVSGIPQQLVSRIDVVTGGVSAVYGSDAVAGVVNFIMDRKFTGLKGELSGGLTTYGDGKNYKGALTAGVPFAEGRGHLLLSGELVYDEGIDGGGKRRWTHDSAQNFANPAYTATNGQPQFLILNNTGYTNAAPGGIIVSGPLRGTQFGAGGTPFQRIYGDIVGDVFMRGGDWEANSVRTLGSIAPSEQRQAAFGRLSYDLSDGFNVYAQASWNRTETFADVIAAFMLNTAGPLISISNPFIPATVRADMVRNNLTSIRVGTLNADSGAIQQSTLRTTRNYEIGAEGKFPLFGAEWRWDAYAQLGRSDVTLVSPRNISRANYALAVDAVVNPANGQIVCRSTLTNPSNGCAPWNPMGVGVNQVGGAAWNFIGTPSWQELHLEQDVFAASVTGELFSLPAGPVSVAFSAEHRRNSATSTVDAGSLVGDHLISNFGRIEGSTKVSEAAAETVIPLLKDTPGAQNLEVSAAVRYTHYSRAGNVTTWKLGGIYEPIRGIKFRATRSRDIRAPNLIETFSPAVTTQATAFDPFTSTSPTFQQTTVGNLDLRPEIATNTALGVVIQPVRNVSFSADLWDIKIKDAISAITSAQILSLCFDRTGPELCPSIERNSAGTLVRVTSGQRNFALQQSRGLDFEASWTLPAPSLSEGVPGTLSLHGNATIFLKQYINTRVSPPTDIIGENGAGNPPFWRASLSAIYHANPLTTSLTLRGFPAGAINDLAIACTSGCPTSTAFRPTYSQNRLPGRVYADFGLAWEFRGGTKNATVFINVRNLLNADPGAPRVSGNALRNGANDLLYDVEGRTFRAGLRFRLP